MSLHSRGLYSVRRQGEYFVTTSHEIHTSNMFNISVRTTFKQAIYSCEIVFWKVLVTIFRSSTTKEAHRKLCPRKERKKMLNQQVCGRNQTVQRCVKWLGVMSNNIAYAQTVQRCVKWLSVMQNGRAYIYKQCSVA